jgi:hypothetical protein
MCSLEVYMKKYIDMKNVKITSVGRHDQGSNLGPSTNRKYIVCLK